MINPVGVKPLTGRLFGLLNKPEAFDLLFSVSLFRSDVYT